MVIPSLNEAERLPRTLARVAEGGDGCEVVVVDGGSTDGTPEVAAAFPGIRVVRAPRSRGLQLNAGAAAARGQRLFFLHADTLPPLGFAARIARVLERPGVVAGSFCLAFDAGGPWLRLYSRCSRLNHTLSTYGDQGLFLCRSTFERIGGYAPIPLLEDVEIQGRLRARGRFVKVPVPAVTSARRFQARGAVRQQVVNGLVVLAYRSGARPEALARLYARGLGPAAVAAELLRRARRRDQAVRGTAGAAEDGM